jgi:uncharacterized membrane protein YoaT (DUF817 family)
MYTVTCLTARNMDNSKYEFCLIKNCQCRTLEVPYTAVGLRSTVWGTPLYSHTLHNVVSAYTTVVPKDYNIIIIQYYSTYNCVITANSIQYSNMLCRFVA